ncbi:hypothetical protein DP117_16260 [Brasilonema sp. UFV-L1]|nr:hypothetical protein [Brasilonema sp. UFV-L1]
MKQDNHQQVSHYNIVLGRNDRDKSYHYLQYNQIKTNKAQVCWCQANQSITVGEVVRGKLQPSENELPTCEHQADSLPTLLVEE